MGKTKELDRVDLIWLVILNWKIVCLKRWALKMACILMKPIYTSAK